MDELNKTSRGKNYEQMKERGATNLGRRNPNGKNKYVEHPDAGQPGVPKHHGQGHIHSTSPKGDEIVIPYSH